MLPSSSIDYLCSLDVFERASEWSQLVCQTHFTTSSIFNSCVVLFALRSQSQSCKQLGSLHMPEEPINGSSASLHPSASCQFSGKKTEYEPFLRASCVHTISFLVFIPQSGWRSHRPPFVLLFPCVLSARPRETISAHRLFFPRDDTRSPAIPNSRSHRAIGNRYS